MKIQKTTVFFWGASLLSACLTGYALSETAPVKLTNQASISQSARIIAMGLPQAHLTHRELSDAIAGKALRNFLDSLDHDHSLFLAKDVEAFYSQQAQLDDFLRKGNTAFAFQVFDIYKERVQDRVSYIHDLLNKGFDFEKDEVYVLDRKNSAWAAGAEEWNTLWRKKIKHEYLSRVVSAQIREEDTEKTEADSNLEETSESDDVAEETIEPLTIEEQISRRYDQLLHVTEGHDEEFILQTYLNAFTRAYDVHSAFHSPRAMEDFAISMKLSLTGIGALLTLEDGAAKVVRLIKGGPAELGGKLKAGDKIIGVAQEKEAPVDILNWPLYKSVRLIRGAIGTKVTLSVIPATDSTQTLVRKITMVRDEIKLEDREAKAEVREIDIPGESPLRVGLVTLPEFYADLGAIKNGDGMPKRSATDIRRLLEEMNAEHVDGLLLDLRNNGGGSLADAIEMTGYFIDRGPVVQVKANRRVEVKRDPFPGMVYDGPMVVLVNRQSASASEILSGALQDYGRAIIVGDSKTHGKGSVQSVFPLDPKNPGLGALKITTAGFYRIDGRSTQLKGVEPDVVVRSAMDVMEIGEEYLTNVLPWSWVSSASYERFQETGGLIHQLRVKSEERLAIDPQYSAYQKLMDRLKEKVSMNEISLELDTRVSIAREDQELQKLQESLSESLDSEAADENKKPEDIILKEALFILRDLVAMPVPS